MKTFTNEHGVPAVEVVLDRPRQLTLSLAALRRLTATEGLGLEALDRLADEGDEGGVLDVIDGIVWAMLVDDDPEVTRAEVASMIHFRNLPDVFRAVGALMVNSMPDVAPDPLDSAPAKKSAKSPAKPKATKKKAA